MVKIVRVEVKLLLPYGLWTFRRLRPIAVKVVDATTDIVASDQMLRSIVFIVTMSALWGGISLHSSRRGYSDLMHTD